MLLARRQWPRRLIYRHLSGEPDGSLDPTVIILAHRGHWIEPGEKNSLAAFERAFAAGDGAELDVRDRDGDLVISHDPATADAPSFETVLALYGRHGHPGRLAVNIKADGLAALVATALHRHGATARSFVFDMSIPDALAYLNTTTPVFTRFSEFEPHPALYEDCAGVWIDSFRGPWASAERAIADLGRGKAVALVSPELHRMPHEAAWAEWARVFKAASNGRGFGERLMICTDFPDPARDAFAPLISRPQRNS